jgi:hypothetical protein
MTEGEENCIMRRCNIYFSPRISGIIYEKKMENVAHVTDTGNT